MDKPNVTYSHRVRMGCGNVYFRIVVDKQGNPKAIFVTIGKAGQCQFAQAQVIGHTISIGLKYGVEVNHYINALKDISCTEAQPGEPSKRHSSCYDALAKILETYPRKEEPDGVV